MPGARAGMRPCGSPYGGCLARHGHLASARFKDGPCRSRGAAGARLLLRQRARKPVSVPCGGEAAGGAAAPPRRDQFVKV